MILKKFSKEWASSKQEQQIKCGMVVTLSDLGFKGGIVCDALQPLGLHISRPQA
jgi:hypothetical protein